MKNIYFSFLMILVVSLGFPNCKQSVEKVAVYKNKKTISTERTIFKSQLVTVQKEEIINFLQEYFNKYRNFLNNKYTFSQNELLQERTLFENEFYSIDWSDLAGTAPGGNYKGLIFDKVSIKDNLEAHNTYVYIFVEIQIVGSFHYLSKEYKDEKTTITEKIIVTQDDGKWKIKEGIKVLLRTKELLLSQLKDSSDDAKVYQLLRKKWNL
jgi:hypothetical protein